MLIDFNYLVRKYKVQFHGVLHVGAHEAEEIAYYDTKLPREKVLWVEALPDKVELCKEKHKNIQIENAVVSDKVETLTFHRSNNGQSSSILELGTHKTHHPNIEYVDSMEVETQLLSTIIAKYPNINFNFLNLDIQGAELKALKGMKSYLHKVDYIYTEVNTESVYEGCALLPELDAYLDMFGLKRMEIRMWANCGWGDAFYIRYKQVQPLIEAIVNNRNDINNSNNSNNITNITNDMNNLQINEVPKISLCITTMNRFDRFLKTSLEQYNMYLDDGLIDEIVISDETGEDYAKIIEKWGDKFRVFKNETRLKVFKNKIRVVKEAKYPIVVLMDSDNFAPREYFVQIRNYLATTKLPNNFILAPAFAKTGASGGFDYTKFNDAIVSRTNVKAFASQQLFQVLLNTGNYVFNRDLIANIKYDESIIDIISACDVIYFNLLAFQQYPDIEMHVVKNLTYEHRVHPGSTYLTEINGKTTNYRETKIIPAFQQIN